VPATTAAVSTAYIFKKTEEEKKETCYGITTIHMGEVRYVCKIVTQMTTSVGHLF
jgi:hypothetical protein